MTKVNPSPGSLSSKASVRVVIVEKTDKELSSVWKNSQIFTYLAVIISSIAAAKSLGDIVAMFSNHCIFNATLSTHVDAKSVRWIVFDSYDTCRWGDMRDCDFAQFFPVASMALAALLATFFAMCGRGGDPTRNLPQPWRIVPVALLLNLMFVAISCVHVKYVFEGFSSFCRNAIPANNASEFSSCEELYQGQSKDSADISLADNAIGARVFAVISFVSWVVGLVILIVRCSTHADFNVVMERQLFTPSKTLSNVHVVPTRTLVKVDERQATKK